MDITTPHQRIVRRQTNKQAALSDDMPALLQRIYQHRGVTSCDVLEKGLQGLHDFRLLAGIDTATQCLFVALQQQQRVLIVGDFDADGATSTALAVSALRCYGFKQVDYLVPNRFEFGYGLTPEIVALAIEKFQPQLIITVDNGIASMAGVDAANAAGIHVLITDHHLPGDTSPAAKAIVNPNQHGDTFPSKNLAGVGVIFYVMLAFRHFLREKNWFAENNLAEPNMAQFLDLVALGTVADVVPLDKNNRILVHQGIQRIRAGKCRAGIQALLAVAKREPQYLVATDLGFAVGPRLNAAGRLDDMSIGIECLLSTLPAQASALATTLDDLNRQRRDIEADMKLQAFEAIQSLSLDGEMPLGLVLFDAKWHQGVIGILAGRLKDKYHRPVIAFAKVDGGMLKGSARSVQGVHIRDVLDEIATQNPGLIDKFGGHAMAAGLSIEEKHLSAFKKAFDGVVRKQIQPDVLKGQIVSDGELLEEEFSLATAELLRTAEPWGQGFPEPLFDGRFRILDQRLVGNHHLKMVLQPADSSQQLDAIAFFVDTEQWPNAQCEWVHVAYRLDVNRFRGVQSVQLRVEWMDLSSRV
ncbi:MAG: single-stranded-DNA-specific exonuclease RecJ [marine bacterium B5-7]|nr:MAG: single-stranded-DNA-specific exonuclease RecJ [marine bacterium B5-7]